VSNRRLFDGGSKGYLAIFAATGAAIVSVVIIRACAHSASTATSTDAVEASRAKMLAQAPQSESAFCEVIAEYAKEYLDGNRQGQSDIKLSKLREERKNKLVDAIGARVGTRDPEGEHVELVAPISEWLGAIQEIRKTGDGSASVVLSLPCQPPVRVETWNNNAALDASDVPGKWYALHGTLIRPSSETYSKLTELRAGDHASFDGEFIAAVWDPDGLHDMSISERGSMTEPEFLFRFTSISKPGAPRVARAPSVPAAPAPAEPTNTLTARAVCNRLAAKGHISHCVKYENPTCNNCNTFVTKMGAAGIITVFPTAANYRKAVDNTDTGDQTIATAEHAWVAMNWHGNKGDPQLIELEDDMIRFELAEIDRETVREQRR